ncbi:ribose-phosphate pyrophosphokinase [Aliikangiella sp. G2MR2-5]|uniref:ribose-phosphate pyrophosphokinase n=1 Tax=Aliikangiella sp. G2MR2-5 TaxID=2788943 RepID=UPI0018AACB2A|nr:ribose-phosphate pyrophosphokinase [Aliikangiella sp. G2MR2-5]
MSDMMLFSGNATPELAQKIANYLDIDMGKAKVGRFSDGEVAVEILENVRGMDVFIVQSTCAPTNESLMELVVMADALRRASAGRITAVVPYFGYARQDRRVRSARVPISAKVVADMMAVVGINRVLTVDLHADQIQGFFDIPVDNVYATPVLIEHIQRNWSGDEIVVSPDVGGVVRARAVAKRMNDAELAIIDKRRPEANKSEVMHIIGDVEGRDCIILDDMVDTAGTLCTAAGALKANGAKSVSAYATHAVLSGKAIENINNSVLDRLVITDTIPLSDEAKNCDRITVLTLSEMLGESIRRVNEEESLSSMFMD